MPTDILTYIESRQRLMHATDHLSITDRGHLMAVRNFVFYIPPFKSVYMKFAITSTNTATCACPFRRSTVHRYMFMTHENISDIYLNKYIVLFILITLAFLFVVDDTEHQSPAFKPLSSFYHIISYSI